MTKRNKIIYWIATIWLALGMTSTGIVQIIKMQEEVDNFTGLGYPVYLMTMIGIWKLLGVVAILMPKLPVLKEWIVLKEWAYAGFFFCMSGAIFSHIAMGHDMAKIAPPLLLWVLTLVSWYMRPAGRKIVTVN